VNKTNYDAKRAAFFKKQHDARIKAENAKKVALAKAMLEQMKAQAA